MKEHSSLVDDIYLFIYFKTEDSVCLEMILSISFYSECGSNLGPLSAIYIYNKLEVAAKNRPTNLIT